MTVYQLIAVSAFNASVKDQALCYFDRRAGYYKLAPTTDPRWTESSRNIPDWATNVCNDWLVESESLADLAYRTDYLLATVQEGLAEAKNHELGFYEITNIGGWIIRVKPDPLGAVEHQSGSYVHA